MSIFYFEEMQIDVFLLCVYRVWNHDQLVTNTTENWVLATRYQELVTHHLFFRQSFNLKGKPLYFWMKDIIYLNTCIKTSPSFFDPHAWFSSFIILGHLKYYNACTESIHPFCLADSLTSENFLLASHVRNGPKMHCKLLSIAYVMYAYGLCHFYLFLWLGN